MSPCSFPGDPSGGQYGQDYGYFQARLKKQGPLHYEWWASRFIMRLVRRYRPAGRLLEIGCGLGGTLRLLEPHYETHGLDVSAFAVELARQAAPRSEIRQMDASDLTALHDQRFDVVLAAHVLEHLPQPGATLAQCAAILQPGGLLVCLVPNTECVSRRCKGSAWFGFRDPGHVSLLAPAEWRDLVAASGLRLRRCFGDGLWDAPYLPLLPTLVQRLFFLLPSVPQFLSGLPLLPARLGEDLVIIAHK